jgi:hypothetical protein
MTKRISAVLVLLLALASLTEAERRNMQVVIVAGTPVRLATTKTLVNRLFIQSRHSNTGLLYLMAGVPTSQTCSAANAAHLTAELGPGDATHPGSSYNDPQGANGNSPPDVEDLQNFCIDGTVNADVAIVSYWRRN